MFEIVLITTWLSILLLFASTDPVLAYVDPGTGSMVLQAIIGALAVGGAVVAGFWQRLKGFVSRSPKPTDVRDRTENERRRPPASE